MLEIIKEILESFIYFDLIEGTFCCYVLHKIFSYNKIKWYYILLLSFGNTIISFVLLPLFSQFFIIIWIGIIFYINEKNINKLNLLRDIFLMILLMGCCQSIFMISLEVIFKINFFKITKSKLFLFFIFSKILEFVFINITIKFFKKGKI